VTKRPPAFVLRCENEDLKDELWSIWEGKERVGTLAGEGDSARLTLWESLVWITEWRGDSPSEKFQNFIVSPMGDAWVHRARLREMRSP